MRQAAELNSFLADVERRALRIAQMAVRNRDDALDIVQGAMLRLARSYGAHVLLLEVRPSNHAARRLYAEHGFEQIGTRRGYYPARDGREDALLLSHAL